MSDGSLGPDRLAGSDPVAPLTSRMRWKSTIQGRGNNLDPFRFKFWLWIYTLTGAGGGKTLPNV